MVSPIYSTLQLIFWNSTDEKNTRRMAQLRSLIRLLVLCTVLAVWYVGRKPHFSTFT